MRPHPSAPLFSRRSGRRGSILMLVLVVLAVLTLMATTLFYIARLEVLAADNAARSVQARMTAVAGLPAAVHLLAKQWGTPVALNQSWAQTTDESETSPNILYQNTLPASPTMTLPAWPGLIEIQDAAARLNINAVLPYPQPGEIPPPAIPGAQPAIVLENLIARRLFDAGYSPAPASSIARLILDYRWGSGGRAARALAASSDNARRQTPGIRAYTADFRETPTPPHRFFTSLDDLRRIPEMPPQAYDTIAPYLTVFSSSLEIWRDHVGETYAPISLNTATHEQIFQALERLYPNADQKILRQFALNVVDRRDPDSIPTVFRGDGPHPIIGYEKTPYISEICPDVITFSEDGDRGEYIEIHNPLPVPADLRGWRMDWGAGAHVLDVILQPGACLVLTDDIQNAHEPTPRNRTEGMGSFLAIFGIPPRGNHLLLENPALNLPDDAGTVRLFDNHGNLIDYLTYHSATFTGNHIGQQRHDRFSHTAQPGPASPFQPKLREITDPYLRLCREILQSGMNTPFRTPAELLAVPCPAENLRIGTAQTHALFPLFTISGGQIPDLRLLDAFTASPLENTPELRPWNPKSNVSPDTKDSFRKHPVAFGKINLNTAPREVLVAIPGLDAAQVEAILFHRSRVEKSARPAHASPETAAPMSQNAAPFQSLSDFADSAVVWGQLNPASRLEKLMEYSPLVTFNSTAFLVQANRPFSPAEEGETPAPGLGCRALVNMVGSQAEILYWRFWFPKSESPGFLAPAKTGTKRNLFDKSAKKH